MSSSNDGLTTVLPPSIVAEHAIGEDSVLTPIRERPEEGSSPRFRCPPLRLRGGADDPSIDPGRGRKQRACPLSKKRKHEETDSARSSACTSPVPQACSTRRNSLVMAVDTSPGTSAGKERRQLSTVSNTRRRAADIPLPLSSDSEAGSFAPPKARKPGRPALTPAHEGQFTARKRRERKILRRDELNRRLAAEACDPDNMVDMTTRRFGKFEQECFNWEEELRNSSPLEVADIVREAAMTIVKVAQRSSNIKGDLVKGLWEAAAKIQAGNVTLTRQASRERPSSLPESAEARGGERERELEREIIGLRQANARLQADLDSLHKKVEALSQPPPRPLSPPKTRSGKIRDEMTESGEEMDVEPAPPSPSKVVSREERER